MDVLKIKYMKKKHLFQTQVNYQYSVYQIYVSQNCCSSGKNGIKDTPQIKARVHFSRNEQ